jgi:DNA processing protein
MEQKLFWTGFNHVKGIGSVRLKGLLDFFGDLSIAWQAPPEALLESGLSNRVMQNVISLRNEIDLEKIWQDLDKKGIKILTWLDASYPRRLKDIDQPPPVLYMRGNITLEDEWAVAIVGTRRVTAYGRQITEEISSYLANNEITIISGLARGVDGIAHHSAINHNGRTIAVLGSGVDRIYPPENQLLAEKIMDQGAILSDYAPGTPPDALNFPPRNRIISGLSLATVVIEAGIGSGALITATFAAEQGREVFAVPGNIHAPQSEGTNQLIQQGARPLLKPSEILDSLNLQQIQEHRAMRTLLPSDEIEAALLKVLSADSLHIDEIRNQTGLPIEKVSAALAMMELKGMVYHAGGMNFTAVREG